MSEQGEKGAILPSILQRILDEAVAGDRAVRGGVLQVTAPNVAWIGACGMADPDRAIPMAVDDQFQIASISKMVTATVLMMLAEEGMVDLDAGIARYLPRAVTEGLHVFRGRAYGGEITSRQLLSHTSGLADFFGDGTPGPGGVLPFVQQMRADPERLWNPTDILAWTKENLRAHFSPGEGWHYSDTGFVLAGLIIERATGQALHDAMRERLFEPLQMAHTYMLFREPARPGVVRRDVSSAFAGDAVYGATRSVTADWACGGLVSTATDLTRFIRAFAEDRIFRRPSTKGQMLTWTPTGEPGVDYGLGVRRFDLAMLGMPGYGELWGHTGFLKSFMLYWPAGDATICGTLNQASAAGTFSELRPVATIVAATLKKLKTHSDG